MKQNRNDRLAEIKAKYIDEGADYKNPDIEWLVSELEIARSKNGPFAWAFGMERLRELTESADSQVALAATVEYLGRTTASR